VTLFQSVLSHNVSRLTVQPPQIPGSGIQYLYSAGIMVDRHISPIISCICIGKSPKKEGAAPYGKGKNKELLHDRHALKFTPSLWVSQ
jgi:hypothetical protein